MTISFSFFISCISNWVQASKPDCDKSDYLSMYMMGGEL